MNDNAPEAMPPQRKRRRPPKSLALSKRASRSVGRPSIYSDAIAAALCDRMATGETLRAICRDPSMPSERTVRGWAMDPDHAFFEAYDKARKIGYYAMFDEMLGS